MGISWVKGGLRLLEVEIFERIKLNILEEVAAIVPRSMKGGPIC